MYKIFGWLNVFFIFIMLFPIVFRSLNNRYFKERQGSFLRFISSMRKLHKPLGYVLFVSAVTHGFLALGSLRLHTGTILGIIVVITSIFGMVFYAVKNKWVVNIHKAFAYILIFLLLIHLILPSAVYYLLGL